MKNRKSVIYLTRGAIIAALYVVFTMLSALVGLSSGVIQFRISEAMCILPLFFPEAVPGLFIGCIIANLLSGAMFWDIVFGSIATLLGALGARACCKLPHKLRWISGLPTIVSNSLIIPPVLVLVYGATDAYYFITFTVFLGEFVCAGIGGFLFYLMLKRTKLNI